MSPSARRFPVAALLALLASLAGLPAPIATADVLELKDGRRIEGEIVLDEGSSSYVVTLPSGAITRFDAADVVSFTESRTGADRFEERFAATDREDLDALVELATWARSERLRPQVRRVASVILEIDPHHEMARRELGYVVFENRWVLESSLRKNRRETGLVKYRGEWMTEAERKRRLHAADAAKLRELIESVGSPNRYVQEYAVEQIFALELEDGAEVFASFLDDEREVVRLVATSGLTRYPATESSERARKTTGKLFARLLEDRSAIEVEVLQLALRTYLPEEAFRLAIDELRRRALAGDSAAAIDARLGDLIHRTLRKAWVPRLCDALIAEPTGRRVEVRTVLHELRRALHVDHGYDIAAWKAWWAANARRFRDES